MHDLSPTQAADRHRRGGGGAVAAAALTAEAAVPGLGTFAPSFVGLVGAMVVLAVARWRRMRLPVPRRPSW
jgi:hypothetical protein